MALGAEVQVLLADLFPVAPHMVEPGEIERRWDNTDLGAGCLIPAERN
jgi:hypothetical protein